MPCRKHGRNHTLFCPFPKQSFHSTSASLYLPHGSCACWRLTAHTITLSGALSHICFLISFPYFNPKHPKTFTNEWIINRKATDTPDFPQNDSQTKKVVEVGRLGMSSMWLWDTGVRAKSCSQDKVTWPCPYGLGGGGRKQQVTDLTELTGRCNSLP